MKLSQLPTFIYIDASNIKNACSRSSHFELDFGRMMTYFSAKYTDLRGVKYFEGIAHDDATSKNLMQSFRGIGYEVFALERKAYQQSALHKNITCSQCGHIESHQVFRAKNMLKSNVDVYLATEFMHDAVICQKPCHMILISCDGDYAEMVKKVFQHYPEAHISIMATPMKFHGMNYLSSRFKELCIFPHYKLINIENIRDKIKK